MYPFPGAIMELEEKLKELRGSHGQQIDDILANQGQIKKVCPKSVYASPFSGEQI